jgi:hypothetical protein
MTLPADVKAKLVTDVASAFDASALVERNIPIMDGAGCYVDTWAVVDTYSCAFYPGSGTKQDVDTGAPFAGTIYTIVFTSTADVLRGDRATVDAQAYQVLRVVISTVTKQAICTEIV